MSRKVIGILCVVVVLVLFLAIQPFFTGKVVLDDPAKAMQKFFNDIDSKKIHRVAKWVSKEDQGELLPILMNPDFDLVAIEDETMSSGSRFTGFIGL